MLNLQKLTPWNWMQADDAGTMLPAGRGMDPFSRMHTEMDRMFRDFFGDLRNDREMLLQPSVDIAESKKAYRVSVEVPGIDPGKIDLEVQGDALMISGEKLQEKEADDEGFHRVERRYGQFRRVLMLPEDADVEHIKADTKNGVLKIRIPRLKEAEAPSTRKVPIEH